jgi:dGTP triphosphohydrolase
MKMKSIINAIVCGTFVLTAAIIVNGCSSSGYSKAGSTSKGMDKAGSEVEAIVAQTQNTLTSLSNLVYNPAPDLVPQYKEFSSDTKKLASLSKSVDAKAKEMKERANDYFKEWDMGMTNITNPELRATSEKRRAEVSSSFDDVANNLKKSKAAFDPFLADLTDIQQVLNLDLTQGGIKSIQKVAKTGLEHGEELRAALGDAAKSIQNLAAKMSAQGPPAAKK